MWDWSSIHDLHNNDVQNSVAATARNSESSGRWLNAYLTLGLSTLVALPQSPIHDAP